MGALAFLPQISRLYLHNMSGCVKISVIFIKESGNERFLPT